jgi:hypothetical protein
MPATRLRQIIRTFPPSKRLDNLAIRPESAISVDGVLSAANTLPIM